MANTPDSGPISINDIRNVFGYGNNQNPGDDLSDYHGVQYFDTFYPFRRGYFGTSQLSYADFYSKTSIDPCPPPPPGGLTIDPNKTTGTIPPFRSTIT